MGGEYEKKPSGSSLVHDTFGGVGASSPMVPGRQSLSEHLPYRVADTGAPVQRVARAHAGSDLTPLLDCVDQRCAEDPLLI